MSHIGNSEQFSAPHSLSSALQNLHPAQFRKYGQIPLKYHSRARKHSFPFYLRQDTYKNTWLVRFVLTGGDVPALPVAPFSFYSTLFLLASLLFSPNNTALNCVPCTLKIPPTAV